MSTSFKEAPIGAKVSVEIGLGAHHVGRKFSQTQVIDFSRQRGGWSIVPVLTFSEGKHLHIRNAGYCPSQAEMLANMQKYKDRQYSLTTFNCDDGAAVLAGQAPASPQRQAAVIGGGLGWFLARTVLGASPLGIAVTVGACAAIAVSMANSSNP